MSGLKDTSQARKHNKALNMMVSSLFWENPHGRVTCQIMRISKDAWSGLHLLQEVDDEFLAFCSLLMCVQDETFIKS